MACYLRTSGGDHRLIVKSFSTNLRSNSGVVQLRDYSSPNSKNVQQQTLRMVVQTRSPSAAKTLIDALRASQLASLNSTGRTHILWPERDMAYEVYVTNVPRVRRLTDTAPLLTLTFGIITGLINTTTAAVTGDRGYSSLIENWLQDGDAFINQLIQKGSPTGDTDFSSFNPGIGGPGGFITPDKMTPGIL